MIISTPIKFLLTEHCRAFQSLTGSKSTLNFFCLRREPDRLASRRVRLLLGNSLITSWLIWIYLNIVKMGGYSMRHDLTLKISFHTKNNNEYLRARKKETRQTLPFVFVLFFFSFANHPTPHTFNMLQQFNSHFDKCCNTELHRNGARVWWAQQTIQVC